MENGGVRRNPPRMARNAGHHHLRPMLGDVTNKRAASAWGGPAHGKGAVADACAARSPGAAKSKSRTSAAPPSPVNRHADAVVTQLSPQPKAQHPSSANHGCPASPELRCSPHAMKTVLVDSTHAAARPRSAFPTNRDRSSGAWTIARPTTNAPRRHKAFQLCIARRNNLATAWWTDSALDTAFGRPSPIMARCAHPDWVAIHEW
jgi:hypothetical protein